MALRVDAAAAFAAFASEASEELRVGGLARLRISDDSLRGQPFVLGRIEEGRLKGRAALRIVGPVEARFGIKGVLLDVLAAVAQVAIPLRDILLEQLGDQICRIDVHLGRVVDRAVEDLLVRR